MRVKAHIALRLQGKSSKEAQAAVLARILERAPIAEINQKRFERYGIVSGLVDDSLLEEIRSIPDVLSVEIDTERFLS